MYTTNKIETFHPAYRQGKFTLIEKAENTVRTSLRRGSMHRPKLLIISCLIVIIVGQVAHSATQVSQFGITWTFDRDYPVGQFANGDYWVVGPVTITNISPGWDGEKHGSMVNPIPTPPGEQAYDGRLGSYDSLLLVEAPVTLEPNTSLISAISWTDDDKEDPNYPVEVGGIPRPTLKTAAVLTVLDSPAPEGSFRPPYTGNNKPIYSTSNLGKELLPNLALVPNTPNIQDVAENFERVWLDHFAHHGDGTQYTSPSENMPNIGHQYSIQIGEASLLLMLDEADLIIQQGSNKDIMLVRLVQLGIDLYEVVENDGYWWGAGVLNCGRKWPILFAGLMLDHSGMKNIGPRALEMPYKGFQENSQIFYVTQHPNPELVWTDGVSDGTDEDYDIYVPNPNPELNPNPENFNEEGYRKHESAGFTYYGHGLGSKSRDYAEYTEEHQGMPDWGIEHHTYPNWDGLDWDAPYRANNGLSYPGYILAALIMDQKEAWNYDTLFDYADRWIADYPYTGPPVNEGYYVYGSDFVKDMWNEYREDYGPVWTSDSNNQAPVLDEIGDKSVDENSLLTFDVNASDADGDAITYSATGTAITAGAALTGQSFSWTPNSTQAGTYQAKFTATAGGQTDSETITITVYSENNTPPVLASIGPKSGEEGLLIGFTASASDSDVPANSLTFSLINAPAGASIDPVTGYFTWIPTEAQGPDSYDVTVRVTDDGAGNLYDEEVVTITVNEVNASPTLSAIDSKFVDEGAQLTFTASASDTDVPGDTLTFSLINAPVGASINPVTGVFTWTPAESQGPDSYDVTVRVTDNSVGSLYDQEAINITVNEINVAPVLGPIDDQTMDVGSQLTFTANATDADVPANGLTFSLSNAPAGASIDPVTGYFTWIPTEAQGPDSYDVTVRVTDDGAGNLYDEESMTITIVPDETDPTVTNLSPAADSIQAPLNTLVILDITDSGDGVDANSVTVKVNNNIVYTGNTNHYPSADGDCRRLGTKADYKFIYHQWKQNFDFDQPINITVNATDLAGNIMDEYSYSFISEMRSFGENKILSSGSSNDNWGPLTTVSDSSGNIWVAWPQGVVGSRDIYVGKLVAGTDSFVSSGVVPVTIDIPDQGNPVIAVDSSDKLYLAWQDNRRGDWDIYVSTYDGINWSAEIRVTDSNDNQINPAIVIDSNSPNNNAYIVWEDDRHGNQDIYVAKSSDGFETKTVSRITSDTSDQVEPAIAADSGNTIYVVWTDTRNSGKNDIYGAASNGSWTNIPIVTEEESQSNPAIATEAVGSVLHLVWLDDTPGDDDIYYASTSDGLPSSPLTGSSIIDPLEPGELGTDQISPVIITTGTGNNLKVFACWRDERNADADLYAVEIGAGAGTNVFVGDDDTSTDQSEPAIGIDEYGHPYLVWINERTDICYAGSTFIEPVVLASSTASVSSKTTVGTVPGSITNIDDVSAELPQGAYLCDVKVTISRIRNPHKPPSNNRTFLYEFGPSGTTFSEPVTITIPYNATTLVSSPSAYWYNPLTGLYSQEGITDVEVIQISSGLYALRFKTTHFSIFGGGGLFGGGGGGGGCSMSPNSQGSIVEFLLPYIGLAVAMVVLKLRDRRKRKAHNITKSEC